MTVQELIDELMKVDDKSKEVIVGAYLNDCYNYQGIDYIKEYEDDITIFTDD